MEYWRQFFRSKYAFRRMLRRLLGAEELVLEIYMIRLAEFTN